MNVSVLCGFIFISQFQIWNCDCSHLEMFYHHTSVAGFPRPSPSFTHMLILVSSLIYRMCNLRDFEMTWKIALELGEKMKSVWTAFLHEG